MSSKSTSSEFWTDEKHSIFLNSMENSFVRTMLEHKTRTLPLDRDLPDSSDSTLDSNPFYQKNKVPRVNTTSSGPRGRNMNGGSEKRSRRKIKSKPLNSSEDQVVPQFELRNVDDKHQNGKLRSKSASYKAQKLDYS